MKHNLVLLALLLLMLLTCQKPTETTPITDDSKTPAEWRYIWPVESFIYGPSIEYEYGVNRVVKMKVGDTLQLKLTFRFIHANDSIDVPLAPSMKNKLDTWFGKYGPFEMHGFFAWGGDNPFWTQQSLQFVGGDSTFFAMMSPEDSGSFYGTFKAIATDTLDSFSAFIKVKPDTLYHNFGASHGLNRVYITN